MTRRNTLLASGTVLVVCVLLAADLWLAEGVAELVLIGTMASDQAIALLAVVAVVAASVLLLALATGRWNERSFLRGVASSVAVLLIVLAGIAAIAVAGFIALFSGVNSYTRIEVPGADREYVVSALSWHHTSYGLLEGHGIYFTNVPVAFAITPDPTDSFANGNYRVTHDGDGWQLSYSSTGDGPLDTTVPFG